MRPVWLAWALALAAGSLAEPAPPGDRKDTKIAVDAVQGESSAASGEGVEYTLFNGQQVPPIEELTMANFETSVKNGNWYVACGTRK
jgi:hypothetical protein